MDTDLDQMTREELIIEVKKLRQGIRQHRDSSQHELCWHPPSPLGVVTRKDRSDTCDTGVAGVHQRLCEISAVAG